ncbi:MAG: glycosyltransferase [Planctomycetota bacterium]
MTDPKPAQSEPSTRGTLVVAAGPSDARAACAELAGRSFVLLVLDGERADAAALRAELAAAGAREVCVAPPPDPAFGAKGGLAARHDLVQRIRAEIARVDAGLVVAPRPDARLLALRAASRAACAAADDGNGRRVAFHGLADGPGELDAPAAVQWTKAALERAFPAAPRTTAVVSTWNKRADLEANVDALRAQTLPFAEIVVVDNASRDGTAELVKARYPDVRLIEMPHDRFGACETFNKGFQASRTEFTAILDDDIVMPPDWLEQATARMQAEPPTTAIVSTQVTEPGMPAGYLASERHNTERYMSTFRGCASLARAKAIAEAGWYDERLFIYGNERDLTCRLLNLGYRVLQYPGCGVFHKTPFGIKMGKRSLYYHARNAWLSMLKYAPLSDLARMPWLVLTRVLLRGSKKEAQGEVTDATGTIGIGRSVRETPGAWWVLARASFSILANVPYCLKHRAPCRAPDFELPLQ